MRQYILSAFIALLLIPCAQAQDKAETIRTLLERSKMGEQLGSMAEGFEQTVAQMNLLLDSAQQQVLIERSTAAFDSTRLAASVRSYFSDEYQADAAQEAAAFLQSPIADTVEALSREGAEPEELQQYAQELQATPPDKARLQLIQRMSEAQQAADFYVDNILGVYHAVIDAAEVLSDRGASVAPPDSSQIRRGAANMAILSFLYTYEEVPQPALEAYVQFFESEAGQWYVRTYSAAVNHAVEQAATSLNEELQAAK